MADPVSITGLVLQIGVLLNQLYSYGKAVRGAQKEIRDLCSELSALRGVLHDVEAQCNSVDDLTQLMSMANLSLDDLAKRLTPRPSAHGRFAQSLGFPLNKKDVTETLSQLERFKTLFLLALMGDSQAVLEDIRSSVRGLADAVTHAEMSRSAREESESRQKLLAQLSPASADVIHDRACSTWSGSQPGSWLINGPLKSWLDETDPVQRLLVLSGISGSGKTTLMSRAIEYVKSERRDFRVAYFYCAYNDAITQESRNILGSWVAQISETDAVILTPFHACLSDRSEIKILQLQNALLNAARNGAPLLLCLDAINESPEAGSLVRNIMELLHQSPKNIRFLISNVPHSGGVLTGNSDLCRTVTMAAKLIAPDIETYIKLRIRQHDVLRAISEAEILQALLPKADGMFRWVDCQMSILYKQHTPRLVIKALQNLSGTLDETYVALLARVPDSDTVFVREALLWLSYSHRPLLLDELSEAVVLQDGDRNIDQNCRLPSPNKILELCQGLAILNESTGTVSLAHSTVLSFLESDFIRTSRVAHFALQYQPSLRYVVRQCLTYLLFDPFQDVPRSRHQLWDLFRAYPFLEYASTRWAIHARQYMKISGAEIPAADLIKQLFETQITFKHAGNFRLWVRTLIPYAHLEIVQKAQPLYYAASYGLTSIVKWLLEGGAVCVQEGGGPWFIDHKCGRGESTALVVACFSGHYEVVKLLLDAGADPDVKDGLGRFSIEYAIFNGHESIMELLKTVVGSRHKVWLESMRSTNVSLETSDSEESDGFQQSESTFDVPYIGATTYRMNA